MHNLKHMATKNFMLSPLATYLNNSVDSQCLCEIMNVRKRRLEKSVMSNGVYKIPEAVSADIKTKPQLSFYICNFVKNVIHEIVLR